MANLMRSEKSSQELSEELSEITQREISKEQAFEIISRAFYPRIIDLVRIFYPNLIAQQIVGCSRWSSST